MICDEKKLNARVDIQFIFQQLYKRLEIVCLPFNILSNQLHDPQREPSLDYRCRMICIDINNGKS